MENILVYRYVILTGYMNISDIITSFGETDSFLYMCIDNIPVIRTSNTGYKNISDIRTYSLIPDKVLITGIDCSNLYGFQVIIMWNQYMVT